MSKKTFYGFLSLVLALGITLACAIGSSWFTNGDIRTWFNGWGQGSSLDDIDLNTETSGNIYVSDETDSEGISLMRTSLAKSEYAAYGISPQAEDAFTIMATVMTEENIAAPDEFQYVTFKMDWAGEVSGAVTDYVTMNVLNTRTAQFTCLKGFNTEIAVTVISDLKADCKSTVKLGYYSRMVNMSAKTDTEETNGSEDMGTTFRFVTDKNNALWHSQNIYPCAEVFWDKVGTKAEEFVKATVTIKLTDEIKSLFGSNYSYGGDKVLNFGNCNELKSYKFDQSILWEMIVNADTGAQLTSSELADIMPKLVSSSNGWDYYFDITVKLEGEVTTSTYYIGVLVHWDIQYGGMQLNGTTGEFTHMF